MTLEEFNNVSQYIINKFKEYNIVVVVPPFYRSKSSFGDIDLLTTNEQLAAFDKDWRDVIIESFANDGHSFICADKTDSEQIQEVRKKSGGLPKGITSFLFDNQYQVDIIYVPETSFQRTLDVLSWNDVAGMVGDMLRTIGMRFSSKHGVGVEIGLGKHTNVWMPENANSIYWFDCGFDVALKLAGLSVEQYKHGFDTQEESFDYIIGSELYYSRCIDFTNGNYEKRKRQQKRTTFIKFLEYVEKKPTIEKKYIDLNLKLQQLGDLIGIGNIKELLTSYAKKESTRCNMSAIIRDARIHCIQQAMDAVYPELSLVEKKKRLQEFYINKWLHSSMSIEECVEKIYSLKFEDNNV
jgi:hypothetical protein